MKANANGTGARFRVLLAVTALCATLNPAARADVRIVTIKTSVHTADLNLNDPSDARRLYARLTDAAHKVCNPWNPIYLLPVMEFGRCVDKAVSDAVRAAHEPQLTLVYLESHTLQQAALSGIAVPIS